MTNVDYLMVACATWYLTHCLVNLPGPLKIFVIMRKYIGVMQCVYCLSLWIGVVVYAFAYVGQTDIVYVFGLVGAGHLLASWTGANYVA